MKPRSLSLLVLCLFALVATAAVHAADITVLKQRVLFDNNNFQVKTAALGVNFFREDPRGRYRVCVKPNGPVGTACPVFQGSENDPQCFLVNNNGPGQRMINVVLVSKPGEPPRRPLRNCALTYSIVPEIQPDSYFGRPEIGIAYGLK